MRKSFLIITLCFAGCGSSNKPAPHTRLSSSDANASGDLKNTEVRGAGQSSTFTVPNLALDDSRGLSSALNGLNQDSISEDHYWALSQCNCGDTFKSERLIEWRQRPGLIPHALVPDLREAVIKDPQVQLVLGLPGALGDLLGDLFIDDAQLEIQLIEGVQEKLKSAVPGGGDFLKWGGFSFELFQSLNSLPAGEFSVDEQTAKWNLIWSMGGMWSGQPSVTRDDHLTQTQQTILSLSEWKYMFGLDLSSVTKLPYGGLGLSKTSGMNGSILPFDPRLDSEGHAFFAGTYNLQYDRAATKMDLSIRGQETWTHTADKIELLAQARLWHAAALAFDKMKPSKRSIAANMFQASGGIVADDAHTLPLAFLPGLSALLDGPFINRDKRKIFAWTTLDEQMSPEADLLDLSALAQALGRWFLTLEDLSSENLDENLVSKLKEGRASIKQALQLTTQNILLNTTDKSFSHRAESLATLAFVATECLESPFLTNQVVRLTNNYFTDRLNVLITNGDGVEANEIFWVTTLLERIESLETDSANKEKINQLRQHFRESIDLWSESY